MNNPKTVLITGATSGIGLAVTMLLVKNGYFVIGIGSRAESCQKAEQTVGEVLPGSSVLFWPADLSIQENVHLLADKVISFLDRRKLTLFALINNAGGVRSRYIETPDGIETQFAINHLAGFILSYRLAKQLASGLIIFTGSRAHKHMKIRRHNLMFRHIYHPYLAYKQTKLANIMTAFELRERLKRFAVGAFVVDPGLVNTPIADKKTGFLVRLVWDWRKKAGTTPDIPAKTYLYLLEHPDAEGLYFRDSTAVPYNHEVLNAKERLRLFCLSEQLTGCDFSSLKES